MKNNYYDVAFNDYLYLSVSTNTKFYNQISSASQQVAEKLLKSVLVEVRVNAEDIVKTHDLNIIYREICSVYQSNKPLKVAELSLLKDMYVQTSYPGEDFILVSEEECIYNLKILLDVIEYTNKFREEFGLNIESFNIPNNPNDLLYKAYKQKNEEINISSSLWDN